MRDSRNYDYGRFYDFDGSDPQDLINNQKDIAMIDDENVSTDTTYSSSKIESLLTGGTVDSYIDDEHSSTGTTYSSNKIEELISGATSGIPLIDKTSDTSSTFDIYPNKMYMFGDRTTLTINLLPGESGIVNEYMFQFTSGNVATTLNVPLTVTWLKDPDIQTNSIYQVSIENNLGIIGEWDNE